MAISIRVQDDKAYIKSPFNRDFIHKIHSIGDAQWESDTREWSVPTDNLEDVKQMLRDVYGTDGSENNEPTVTVKLTATDNVDLTEIQSIDEPTNMVIFGRPILSARGRDNGVKVEKGVTVRGKYKSGGSTRYPTVVFDKGAEIIIKNMPESQAKRLKLKYMTTEIISEPKIDRQALLAEKERLLKRIAEIDQLL